MAFNYGGRTGVASIIRWTKKLCDIYLSYASSIMAYVENSSLSAPQKETVLTWLNGAQEACMILELIEVKYENA